MTIINRLRITKNMFHDLAIYMMGFGFIVGIIFPFFCIIMRVPKEIALRPFFFILCVFAGLLVGGFNILLAHYIVGPRISAFSSKMHSVELHFLENSSVFNKDDCNIEKCKIDVTETDELAEAVKVFNNMIYALLTALENQSDYREFSNMLTNSIDLEVLSNQALNQFINLSKSSGGALFIEENGEFQLMASESILNPQVLVSDILMTKFHNPEEIRIMKIIEEKEILENFFTFNLKEVILLPIKRHSNSLGFVILASDHDYTRSMLEKLDFISQPFTIAVENAVSHQQLQALASNDHLTGLYNRRFGYIRLEEEFQRSMRSGTPLGLLMLDLDFFKSINDTYGHQCGDRVLISTAKALDNVIRTGDISIRYGGDEFMCLLPDTTKEGMLSIAERIRREIEENVIICDDQMLKFTISIGAAFYTGDNFSDIHDLIKLADDNLYISKNEGRNRVSIT